jgi:hypothetical protein
MAGEKLHHSGDGDTVYEIPERGFEKSEASAASSEAGLKIL